MKIKKHLKKSLLLTPSFFIPLVISNSNEIDIKITSPQKNELIKYLPVQNFSYKNQYFTVKKDINIVLDEKHWNNEIVKDLETFLRNKAFNVQFTHKFNDANINHTNIIFGIGSYEDLIAKYNVGNQFSEDKIDEYFIESENDKIFIQANDFKTSLYALNDLKTIFNNLDNNTFKDFKIHNYFDVEKRLVYDTNNSDNQELEANIKIAATNRFNKYAYLNINELDWREDYNQDELDKIKAKTSLAKMYNLNFVYTLDILSKEPINDGQYYDFDLNILKTKMQKLIDHGVDDFGFVVKNTVNFNYELFTKVLNDLSEWLKPQNKDLYYFTTLNSNTINNSFQNLSEYVTVLNFGVTKYDNFDVDFITRYNTNTNKKAGLLLNWPQGANEGLVNLDLFNNLSINKEALTKFSAYAVSLSNSAALNNYLLNHLTSVWFKNGDNKEQFNYDIIKNTLEENNSVTANAFLNISKHIVNTKITNSTSSVDWNTESQDVTDLFNSIITKYPDKSFTNKEINNFRNYFENLKQDLNILLNKPKGLILVLKPWLDKLLLIANINLKISDVLEYIKANLVSRTKFTLNEVISLYRQLENITLDGDNPLNGGTKVLLPKTEELVIMIFGSSLAEVPQTTAPSPNSRPTNATWYTDGSFIQAESGNVSTTGGRVQNIADLNPNTEWIIRHTPENAFPENWNLTIKYPTRRTITSVLVEQGINNPNNRLSEFSITYYDYSSNSWKNFGSLRLNNDKRHVIGGYAQSTDKIRIQSHKALDVNLRIGTFLAGGENVVSPNESISAYSTNLDLSNNLENNSLNLITDNNNTTYARLTHKGGGAIQSNDSLDILFPTYREVSTIRLIQEPGLLLNKFKVQKIVNDTYTDIIPQIRSDIETVNINIPANTGKINGIRLVAIENSSTEWGVKSVYLVDKKEISENYLYLSNQAKASNFEASYEAGNFILNNKTQNTTNIQLDSGEILGFDFKKVLNITKITSRISNQNIKYFVSNDGYNWNEISDIGNLTSPLEARYLSIRNSASGATSFNFSNLEVYTEDHSLFGNVDIASTAQVKDKEKIKSEFDNNFETSNIFINPRTNQTIVYDLGRLQDINSLRLYAANKSFNFPRNIKIQFSADKLEWKDGFNIKENGAISNTNKLEDTIYGLFDPKHSDHRYWGNDNLNLQGIRFIRLQILDNYPQNRDLEINQIVINNQEHKLVNVANYKFNGQSVINLVNNKQYTNLTEIFRTKKEVDSLSFEVDHNVFNNKNLVIFGNNPSSRTYIKATLVNTNTGQSQEITLGKFVLNSMSFSIPISANQKLEKLTFSWEEKNPNIQTLSLVDKGSNSKVVTAELNKLLSNIPSSFESWSETDKKTFNSLRSDAINSLTYNTLTQETIDDFKNEVQYLSNKGNKYILNTTKLSDLVQNAVVNENNLYTSDSFAFYTYYLENGKNLLANKELLDEAKYSLTLSNLIKAQNNLKYSNKTKSLFFDLNNRYKKLSRNLYTQDSLKKLDDLINLNAYLLEGNNLDTLDGDTLVIINEGLNSSFDNLIPTNAAKTYSDLSNELEKAKQIEEIYKDLWTDSIKPLQEAIKTAESYINNFINNDSITDKVLIQAINDIKTKSSDFETNKNQKLAKLKQLVDNEFVTMSQYFSQSSADAYKLAYNDAKDAYNNQKTTKETVIDNTTKILEDAKNNLEVNLEYFKYVINSVENQAVKEAFEQKMRSISNQDEVLDFLKLFNSYLVPAFYRVFEAKKDEFIKDIQKYQDKTLVKEATEKISRTYDYDTFEQEKASVLTLLEESEQSEIAVSNRLATNRSVGLGLVFLTFGVFIGLGIALYWFKIKKRNK
ncbi:hyaluronidase [Mycoplasmopsis bovirhinis]|uniref:hypothetical protein n=1 Tax=Mycoplasmopsis bovirhinis TaxID=29553 RepID=UPI000BB9CDEA|nr:hypothetical protein [Mycoplasmopsis bovirhinis]BBA22202.1 hyaluronidase [Mycoplasmopsis bovirhinis]